ncbi:hypothetical protein [Novosphingobium sp.]|uniref:hypothetical protein n=1 Tax=Novosphingobium sp. TaxID=1874826 RepID=UPI00286E028E|nr:hypothetical protein [Novosphingobium sp.]
MSLPDITAIAALSGSVIKPVFFVWLDIDGGPVRCNTSGHNITPTGTGDADLDDHEFIGIGGDFVDITPVKHSQGGSESVTAQLSGIAEVDADTLALIEDAANWRGRDARLWRVIRNAANVQQGGYHGFYTGKMVSLLHSGDDQGQVLSITIESYLAVFSEASNRTYMDQDRYDAGDLSAKAAIAIANGNFTGAPSGSTYNGAVLGGARSWQDSWTAQV